MWLRRAGVDAGLVAVRWLSILAHLGSKLWTAAELEQLTPAQRHEVFEASIVHDLADAPPELLARTRARAERSSVFPPPGEEVPDEPDIQAR